MSETRGFWKLPNMGVDLRCDGLRPQGGRIHRSSRASLVSTVMAAILLGLAIQLLGPALLVAQTVSRADIQKQAEQAETAERWQQAVELRKQAYDVRADSWTAWRIGWLYNEKLNQPANGLEWFLKDWESDSVRTSPIFHVLSAIDKLLLPLREDTAGLEVAGDPAKIEQQRFNLLNEVENLGQELLERYAAMDAEKRYEGFDAIGRYLWFLMDNDWVPAAWIFLTRATGTADRRTLAAEQGILGLGANPSALRSMNTQQVQAALAAAPAPSQVELQNKDKNWWKAYPLRRLFWAMGMHQLGYASEPGADRALLRTRAANALALMQAVEATENKYPAHAADLRKARTVDSWRQTATDLIELYGRSNPPRANVQLKFRGLFIEETRLDQVLKDGKRYTSNKRITDSQRERAQVLTGTLRTAILAWTKGVVQISWDFENIDAPLLEISESDWYGTMTRTPVDERVQGYDWSELWERTKSTTDVYYIFWNGRGIANVATGGLGSLPIIPYQLGSPMRGIVHFPVDWAYDHFADAAIHEFFHVVEHLSGITPTHGFSPAARGSFPAWKGSDQIDYFRWHITTTLPQASPVFAQLDIRKRYPFEDARFGPEVVERHRAAVAQIPVARLRQAADLAAKADAYWWNNLKAVAEDVLALGPGLPDEATRKKRGLELAQQAIALNPARPNALRILGDAAKDRGDFAAAASAYERLLALVPEEWLYFHIGYIYQWSMKQPKNAIRFYEEFVALYPDNLRAPEALLSLGRCYMDSGDAKLAQSSFIAAQGYAQRRPAAGSLRDGKPVTTYTEGPNYPAQAVMWQGYLVGTTQKDYAAAVRLIQESQRLGNPDPWANDLLKAWGNR